MLTNLMVMYYVHIFYFRRIYTNFFLLFEKIIRYERGKTGNGIIDAM